MIGLLHDVRFAVRRLRRNPGFSITAAAMLAMAICANSTIFSWINGTMLHPIPLATDTESLVSVMRGQWSITPSPPFSYPDYRDLREGNRSFSGMIAYQNDWLTLTGGATAERIYVANVSANYFDLLGIRPALGRFFLPEEEERKGGVPYVVLSYSLWQTRFGGDPGIVGKPIEIARRPLSVIGIAPAGFINAMPGVRDDAWLPLDPLGNNGPRMASRGANYLSVLGRLRPGVSRAGATQDLEVLMGRLVKQYPEAHPGVNTITLDPLWRSPYGANVYLAASLPILLGIAGLVLLLACANVATLALIRFVWRRREIAIRQALGAGRIQIMRQMIAEGMLVSLAGGALALMLTTWTASRLGDFIPANSLPIVLSGLVDRNVMLLVLLLVVLAAGICGALTAWRASRAVPAEVLKDEAASVSGGRHNRHMLSTLVVTQIALSVVLLVCCVLLLRTLSNMNSAELGFEQDHVLTASLGLGIAGYSPEEQDAIQHKILDQIAGMPGVKAMALTDWLPLSFNGRSSDVYPENYVPRLHESHAVRRADVTPGFFTAMGIPILAGRDFTRDDVQTAPGVAIVDQTAAAHYWPGVDAIGHRLRVDGQMFSVVGVAGNSKHQFINEHSESMVYLSFFQRTFATSVVLRTDGDPTSMAPVLERAIHQVDGRIPVFDLRSLRETTQISSSFAVIESTFAGIFALIALLLSATGIYGVVAYRTQLRRREIGIRAALGASRSHVVRLVLRQGAWLTLLGLGVGLALSFGLTRFITGLLYGIRANDPLTIFGVVLLLGAISLLACYIPAHRAMRRNPLGTIREL
jgi:predicted permease